jgi:signal transduction histidine kinase
MKNVHSIKNEIILKEKALLVVKAMHEYNQNEQYFEYPRFKTFESGLYDEKFLPIFSLLNYKIEDYKEGYHLDGNDAYLILKLPKNRYFDASYLIVKNSISFANVYEKVTIVLFSIVLLVFMLSLFFLNRFAKPFKTMNETLDNFIKDSMHEINTPLSIINVNIDLYNRKNPTNKYMQRMKAATKVLSNIYNDMDYLIKHDRLKFDKESINMTTFLKDRIEYFSEVARMKNLLIKSNILDGVVLQMNPQQLQRVIDNNISNAIKYSYEDNIIEIDLYKKDDQYCMSFKDYGVGIDDVEKIFSRYYREDTQKGGFGIGLNIVRSIILEAKIEVEIISEIKKGTNFIYKFPHAKMPIK